MVKTRILILCHFLQIFEKMDYDSIEVTCRNCKRNFPVIKSMLQHMKKSSCKLSYNEDHFTSIEKHSNQLSRAKKKFKAQQRYQRNKDQIKNNVFVVVSKKDSYHREIEHTLEFLHLLFGLFDHSVYFSFHKAWRCSALTTSQP